MMKTIKRIISTLVVFSSAYMHSNGQNAIDSYVREALSNNDGIKEQQFQLDKSILALREARTLFLPSVSLHGDYTKAQGGRTIELPIGNLLNPAYSTLNQLTHSENFPTLENATIQMNPDNYYDARLQTSMPLVNAELYYAKQIKKQAIGLQRASVNVYKRALVKDVKAAYFLYYQAVQSISIYKEALALVEKNISVNESLLKNGVTNGTALTRAQTEKAKVLSQISFAENKSKNAKAYFNFLLNRSFESEINIDSPAVNVIDVQPDLYIGGSTASAREELQQMSIRKDMQILSRKLEQVYIVPKLNTFLNIGSQGFNWEVNDQSRYYLFGLNLQWDLFAWGRHNYRIRQAEVEVNATEILFDKTEKALQLALTQSLNDYNSAVSNYYSTQSQKKYAEKYYADQLKAYKIGQLLYIELIDAQNQLTAAQIQLSMAFANVQIAKAETERNLATYPLN